MTLYHSIQYTKFPDISGINSKKVITFSEFIPMRPIYLQPEAPQAHLQLHLPNKREPRNKPILQIAVFRKK